MKINYKPYSILSGNSTSQKKFEKLLLPSRGQTKALPPQQQPLLMTEHELKTLRNYESPHNRQVSGHSQPVQSSLNNALTPQNPQQKTQAKTPKARLEAQKKDGGGNMFEEGTVLCHQDMDSMHSKDIRNLTESMVQQELERVLSPIEAKREAGQKLNQSGFANDDALSKSMNLDLSEHNPQEDSFIDQNLLSSMRDIAHSVSKVADQEMANYFHSIMREKQNIKQLNQTIDTGRSPYDSPPRLANPKPQRSTLQKKLNLEDKLNRSLSKKLEVKRSRTPLLGSKSHRDVSGGAVFMSTGYLREPVYQRLYDTQTLYNQRLQGKKLLRYREETAQMKEKPEISQKAKKMSENARLKPIYDKSRIQGVLSQKNIKLEQLKDEVARKRLQQEGELERMNRRFNVHGSGQKKPIPLSKWNDKVDILVKVYNERNKKKAKQKVENELGHSHSPALCQKSRKMLEKKAERSGAIQDRLLLALERKDEKLKRLSSKTQPQFMPTLNQNSLKMIDEKVKDFMMTSESLDLRQTELMESRKDQFKAKQRILEGEPAIKLDFQLSHDRIIEMSPSEEQSEPDGKKYVWMDSAVQKLSQEMENSRPSSINSSVGIISKFKDLLA